jgi:hypothetical protein
MKQTFILTGILGASLLGSYVTWTSDSTEPTEDGIAIFSSLDLMKLEYKSENVDVTIAKRSDPSGDYHWVSVTERKRIKKPKPPKPEPTEKEAETPEANAAEPEATAAEAAEPEATAAEAAEPEATAAEAAEPEEIEEIETNVLAFRGNNTAEKLWEAFSPLMAVRQLDADPSLASLGFGGEKSGVITISQRTEELVLEIGGETYGSKDRYLKHKGKVYLVDDKHLRSISSAKARLIERRVHPLTEKEIDQVSLSYGHQQVILNQHNSDDRAAAFWARDGESKEDSAAGTWLGKLFRIKVQSYVEEDPSRYLTPVFTTTLTGKEQRWTVEIFRDGDGSNPDYYAKTTFNHSLVKLTKSLASDAAEDISAIFNTVEVSP